MRRHKELIQAQASLLHYKQYQQDSQETMRHIRQYECDREMMIEKLENLEAKESAKKYDTVMEWIAGAQTHLDHEAFCAIRDEYKGSGDWILKHEKVQNWREADTPVSSILWLNGIPGAGKLKLPYAVFNASSLLTSGRQDDSCLCDNREMPERESIHYWLLLLQRWGSGQEQLHLGFQKLAKPTFDPVSRLSTLLSR